MSDTEHNVAGAVFAAVARRTAVADTAEPVQPAEIPVKEKVAH
ncbi:hypothetical protein QP976_05525 [Corynebacterium striatum]|nr:hypothetical protein [Corynebacterium striatum]MDK8812452.1 hypothetical protein [Corynebacterium striatum]